VLTTEVKPTPEIVAGVGDGSIDVGLLRCPSGISDLERRTIRLERQGVLVQHEHRLASCSTVDVSDLAEETLLLHPRDANPGHFDAVLELCRRGGVEPRILLRTLSFDLSQTPLAQGEAVAIVGESSQVGLSGELRWLPLSPPAELEVSLIARRYGRSPALDRLLETAVDVAGGLGWLRRRSGDAGTS
jgi:DNA-binding transcriptional LysR family regulator